MEMRSMAWEPVVHPAEPRNSLIAGEFTICLCDVGVNVKICCTDRVHDFAIGHDLCVGAVFSESFRDDQQRAGVDQPGFRKWIR